MTNFYTDCLTNGSCVASDVSTASCFACLYSQSTDTKWGAVIAYADSAFLYNLGGCYALIGGSASCAAYAQEQNECEVAACVGSCGSAASTTVDACVTSADSGECSVYVSGVTSACGTTITSNASCGGTATTDQEYFTAIAATLCE